MLIMLSKLSPLVILFILSPFVSQSMVSLASSDCAPYPISVPLCNVSLGNTTARGISLSIGSPSQPFAFLPQWPLNDTFVYPLDGYCGDSWSDAACDTFRGGSYDTSKSSTYQDAANEPHLPEASPYPSFDWAADNFTLNSNITLGGFPIGIARADWGEQGYHPQSALGLGRNSTILNSLYEAGHIASRSWAMYWGQTGATSSSQQNGSFVFGGFDRAKTTGSNYTSTLDYSKSSCSSGMLVVITNMELNFPNGTSASLFDGVQSAAMTACIVPDYPVLMTIPLYPYFDTFQELTDTYITDRSFGIYYYGMVYANSSIAYAGDFTITLSSGLSVRIRNDQLVVPNLTIDKSNGTILANSTSPELVLNSIQATNSDDLPQLGRQFLAAAYIFLNQDTNTYTMWEANEAADEDLVAVDSSGTPVSEFCTASSFTTTSPVTTTSTSSVVSGSSSGGGHLSGGAIAGIAVGSVAGVALVACVAFYIFSRRRRSKSEAAAVPQQPEVVYRRDGPPSELHTDTSDRAPPFEMNYNPPPKPHVQTPELP